MTGEIDDGGPAFDSGLVDYDPKTGKMTRVGSALTVRDWFAGMALQGLLSGSKVFDTAEADHDAAYAYAVADAMLAARKAKP